MDFHINNKIARYLFPFILFAIALSFKDIFIKQGLSISHDIGFTMALMGFSFLFLSMTINLLTEKRMILKHAFSWPRFLCNIVANITMVTAIYFLDASSVNVLNKSTIPLIILLGSIFGFTYSRQEKGISLILILAVLGYSFYLVYFLSYSFLGVMIFFISLVTVSIEFLFLAKACKSGNILDITLSPSLALIAGGFIVYLFNDSGSFIKYNSAAFLFPILAGISLFFSYFSSPMRYKLLPPGISESPTIFSFFFIYTFEVIVGTKLFNIYDILFSIIILFFSIWLIFSKIKTSKANHNVYKKG